MTSYPPDWFNTTQWSLVRRASDGQSMVARDALQSLCTAYWQPLFAYVKSKGIDEHDAADLTQEFFASLLARNDFAALQPDRGRFRAFLLAAINHFLSKHWRQQNAAKRGKGVTKVSWEVAEAQSLEMDSSAEDSALQLAFDRDWGETVLARAAKRLRAEFIEAGRESLFQELNAYLSEPAEQGAYQVLAERLQTTKAAIAMTIQRMRRRYRELARDEIAQTVGNVEDLDDEIRYLLRVLVPRSA